MKHVSKNLEDTQKIAEAFIATLSPGSKATIVGLHGNLGSGKTTFTQAVAKILGITETVTSPTFVIEKIYVISYAGFLKLIHIDAYRLESGRELENLSWKEIADNPHNLILLEWPEKVAEILPKDMKKIEFTFVDEGTREIRF